MCVWRGGGGGGDRTLLRDREKIEIKKVCWQEYRQSRKAKGREITNTNTGSRTDRQTDAHVQLGEEGHK